jgi:hypothetical protein
MKKLLWPSIFLTAVILFGCASGGMYTFSDYYKGTDFSPYKTYAWIPPNDSILSVEQIEGMYGKLIMSASNAELKKKGMVLETKQPDALFKFELKVKAKIEYSQSPTVSVGVGVGGPYYYGGVAVPVAGGNITEKNIDEATLTIRMFDTRTGAQLWTGGVRKTVNNSADTEKNVRLALSSIFSKLPIHIKKR